MIVASRLRIILVVLLAAAALVPLGASPARADVVGFCNVMHSEWNVYNDDGSWAGIQVGGATNCSSEVAQIVSNASIVNVYWAPDSSCGPCSFENDSQFVSSSQMTAGAWYEARYYTQITLMPGGVWADWPPECQASPYDPSGSTLQCWFDDPIQAAT